MATNLQLRSAEGSCYCEAFTALKTAFGNNEQHMPVPVNRTLRKIKLVNESPVKGLTPKERARPGHALPE